MKRNKVALWFLMVLLLFSMTGCGTTKEVKDEEEREETTARDEEEDEENYLSLPSVEIGSVIEFGAYEQDNNLENGKEAVEWIVLDKEDGSVFVISKYALDCHTYNDTYEEITWAESSLRKWLNDEFRREAFSKEERGCIIKTEVENHDGDAVFSSWTTEGGKDTKDYIYLLSLEEAIAYYNAEFGRVYGNTTEYYRTDALCVQATPYAISNGSSPLDAQMAVERHGSEGYEGNVACWLRSPGWDQKLAMYVHQGAYLDGNCSVNISLSVRPVMWLRIEETGEAPADQTTSGEGEQNTAETTTPVENEVPVETPAPTPERITVNSVDELIPLMQEAAAQYRYVTYYVENGAVGQVDTVTGICISEIIDGSGEYVWVYSQGYNSVIGLKNDGDGYLYMEDTPATGNYIPEDEYTSVQEYLARLNPADKYFVSNLKSYMTTTMELVYDDVTGVECYKVTQEDVHEYGYSRSSYYIDANTFLLLRYDGESEDSRWVSMSGTDTEYVYSNEPVLNGQYTYPDNDRFLWYLGE
ncbi:MAG: hypothetical protein IJX66_09855 [Lachnospiraceae bacterium]|nr:hypothetical protein [Lachnospiraceae bacterium]